MPVPPRAYWPMSCIRPDKQCGDMWEGGLKRQGRPRSVRRHPREHWQRGLSETKSPSQKERHGLCTVSACKVQPRQELASRRVGSGGIDDICGAARAEQGPVAQEIRPQARLDTYAPVEGRKTSSNQLLVKSNKHASEQSKGDRGQRSDAMPAGRAVLHDA